MAKVAAREQQVPKVIRRKSEENLNASISVELPEIFRFGEFCFSLRERRLTRGTKEIALAPKAQDMLYLFLEHPGQLLSKEFLLQKLWPDSFVEEGALTVYVSILRKALGDATARCRYILSDHAMACVPGWPARFNVRSRLAMHQRPWSLAGAPKSQLSE